MLIYLGRAVVVVGPLKKCIDTAIVRVNNWILWILSTKPTIDLRFRLADSPRIVTAHRPENSDEVGFYHLSVLQPHRRRHPFGRCK